MDNINLLFNKEYYRNLNNISVFKKDVKRINELIIKSEFTEKDYISSPFNNTNCIILKTCYPGLLIGTGNPHGAGKRGNKNDDDKNELSNDISAGFSFDYVTGQPYIPGSSVKGVLRSHFKYRKNAVKEIIAQAIHRELSEKAIENLEHVIFDNNDVFLDAVIFDSNFEKYLIGFDCITPHPSPIVEPVPIHIFKILPDVKIEFRFLLSNHTFEDENNNELTFSVEETENLFKTLLILFGVGAKTNVGYGILEETDKTRTEKRKAKKKSNFS